MLLMIWGKDVELKKHLFLGTTSHSFGNSGMPHECFHNPFEYTAIDPSILAVLVAMH